METRMIAAILTGAGALGACLWGFIKAAQETEHTQEKEKFNFLKASITVLPSIAAGFIAGYQMDPSTVSDFGALILAGYGLAKMQGDAGINGFFDKEE